MVTKLEAASKEIADLKTQLRQKDEDCQELQKDLNLHAIKAAELSGIIDARSTDDAINHNLKVKTLQNVELTLQVQGLRSDLSDATTKIGLLKRQQTVHQRLMLELGEVARAIQRLPAISELPAPPLPNKEERPLHRLKAKIEGLESKWRSLVEEKIVLLKENAAKETKIKALECLFHNLNANCMEGKDKLTPIMISSDEADQYEGENTPMVPDRKLFVCRSEALSLDALSDSIEISAIFEEGSTSYDKSGDVLKPFPIDSLDDGEEVHKNMGELVIANDQYKKLQLEFEESIDKTALLEKELSDSKKEILAGKKKQEMREKLLRDLIFQYKELQKEHEDAIAKVAQLQDTVDQSTDSSEVDAVGIMKNIKTTKSEISNEKQLNDESSTGGEDCSKRGRSVAVKEEAPDVEPCSTFELSDSSTASRRESSSTQTNVPDISSLEGMELEFEETSDRYERLEGECARLEHEYDAALAKISDIEQELLIAQSAAEEAEGKWKKCEVETTRLSKEHQELEEEHQLSLDRIVHVEKELDEARIQAIEARNKRIERDGHLWQVIKEYRELAEKKEHAEAEIESVQEQLLLTKKTKHRRDLVCEYRKMENDYLEAKDRITDLEKELKYAKSDASRSKEEAKSTRKRLAGCHFHYKKLQKQYDEALSNFNKVDKELKESQFELESIKAHEDAWADKLVVAGVVTHRSDVELERLLVENKDLKTMCEELMAIAEGDAQ